MSNDMVRLVFGGRYQVVIGSEKVENPWSLKMLMTQAIKHIKKLD